jgi:hypothetical protein
MYAINGTDATEHQATRPWNPELSIALDRLIIQLETGSPGRWSRRILKLRKLVLEHRAMGRAVR